MMRRFCQTAYMDVRTGSATLAKISTSTFAAPARNSARAQPSTVAPEVSTSSTRTRRRPAICSAAVGRDFESALHIEGALCPRQPDLLGGGLHALERPELDRNAALGRDCDRERGRLIEAARPQPAPMQRHRDQRVGFGENFASRLADPASHHRRNVELVAIFEGMNERPRNLVEAHGGASALIGRRVGDRCHRQDARTRVIGERNAKTLAIGTGDEGELRPARRA